MHRLTLIVMAAGIGSRYGGLKQVEPIGPNGELIIDYSVYDALSAGFSKVVFVVNEEIEAAFRERVGATIEPRCETAYVIQRIDDVPPGFTVPPERKKPWGTAHAVLSCKDVVESPFAVINADDFYGRTSFHMLSDYLGGVRDHDARVEGCLVGYELGKTLSEHGPVTRGVCRVDESGYLVRIDERTRIQRFDDAIKYDDGENWVEIAAGTIVSMNMWGFTPALFSELGARFPRFLHETKDIEKAEFLLPAVVGDMLKEKRARVKVLSTGERWFGVTYQLDRAKAKEAAYDLIRRGVYPENLWGSEV